MKIRNTQKQNIEKRTGHPPEPYIIQEPFPHKKIAKIPKPLLPPDSILFHPKQAPPPPPIAK